MLQFITHSVHIFSNIDRTESNEQDSFNMCLTLVHFENFALPYSRVGAGAGAAGPASKFIPGAGAA
jgi:hypothetical protein